MCHEARGAICRIPSDDCGLKERANDLPARTVCAGGCQPEER